MGLSFYYKYIFVFWLGMIRKERCVEGIVRSNVETKTYTNKGSSISTVALTHLGKTRDNPNGVKALRPIRDLVPLETIGSLDSPVSNDLPNNRVTKALNESERVLDSYLFYFYFTFFCAGVLQLITSQITVYKIPISIIWFLFGMGLYTTLHLIGKLPGLDSEGVPIKYQNHFLLDGLEYISKIKAEAIYEVFIPILLYDASLHIKWHHFKRFVCSGITLAVLGVGYQVAIVGLLFYVTLSDDYLTETTDEIIGTSKNGWYSAFLITSSLVSTDPIAVISVLQTLNAPVKLATMFEGEALINDGSSVLLFQFFKSLTLGNVVTYRAIFSRFLSLILLAPIFGYLSGMLAYHILKYFRQYPDTQTMLLMSMSYMVFFIGEKYVLTSGPLAIVCFGLYYTAYGHIGMGREGHQQHLYSIHVLSQLANTGVFIVAGVVTMRMLLEVTLDDNGVPITILAHVPILYIYLIVGRASMILLFLPILRRTGYGVNWKEFVLLIWGGLRGAIVLAMGLMIEQEERIIPILRYRSVLYIAGTTLFLLILNGVSFELLFRYLNPYPPKPFRRVYLERVMRHIDEQYHKEGTVLEQYWLFKGKVFLAIADRVVPKLGWRRMDKSGRIDMKLPSIAEALAHVPDQSELFQHTKLHQHRSGCSSIHRTYPSDSPKENDKKYASTKHVSLSTPSASSCCFSNHSPDSTVQHCRVRTTGVFPRIITHRRKLMRDISQNLSKTVGPDVAPKPNKLTHITAASLLGLNDVCPLSGRFDAVQYINFAGLLRPRRSRRPMRLCETSGSTIFAGTDSHVLRERSAVPSVPQKRNDVGHPFLNHRSLWKRLPTDMYQDAHLSDVFFNEQTAERPLGCRNPYMHRNALGPYCTTAAPEQRHSASHHRPSNRRTVETRHEMSNATTTPYDSYTKRSRKHTSFPVQGHPVLKFHSNRRCFHEQSCHPTLASVNANDPISALPQPERCSLDMSNISVSKTPSLRKWKEHKIGASQPLVNARRQKNMSHSHRKTLQVYGQKTSPRYVSHRDSIAQDDGAEWTSVNDSAAESISRFLRLTSWIRSRSTHHKSCAQQLKWGDSDAFQLNASHSKILHPSPNVSSYTLPVAQDASPLTPILMQASEAPSADRREKKRKRKRKTRRQGTTVSVLLQKEREGELYMMVFNAIRAMYHNLYDQHLVSAAAMRSLNAVLDCAVDFTIGKLRYNPIRAWKEALVSERREYSSPTFEIDTEEIPHSALKVRAISQYHTATSVNYELVECSSKKHAKKLKNLLSKYKKLSASLALPSVLCYLQQVCAFVDVHEELLYRGGDSLRKLLGPKLLLSYHTQIEKAKCFVSFFTILFPNAFQYALVVHAASLLIHLKQQLVYEQKQKGLLLEEDSVVLLQLLQDQRQNLLSFQPFSCTTVFVFFTQSAKRLIYRCVSVAKVLFPHRTST